MTDTPHSDPDDRLKVDASPTKEFFVDIITRDIELEDAIQDLVDNCIDGAKRLRPSDADESDPDYNGLWVNINFSNVSFSIEDNCGGIPLDIARHYAFKFGRAEKFDDTPYSVGQFGIGMKRALFKMGDHFIVKSNEPKNQFNIEVDVINWKRSSSWDFRVSNLVEFDNDCDEISVVPPREYGTSIVVTKLEQGVTERLSSGAFEGKLKREIETRQQHPMRLGLSISVNGSALIPKKWQLKNEPGTISASYKRYEDDINGSDHPLITRIYAGIGDVDKNRAGWYIFCNGRNILEANQDDRTGWSAFTDAGDLFPKYHGQYARFRGYAFLESRDSSILPWNTTKTGLDMESSAYRVTRSRLMEITRPILTFLNTLDNENDQEIIGERTATVLDRAASVSVSLLPVEQSFHYNKPAQRQGPKLVSVSFKKSQTRVEALRDALDASSNKETGEKAFEYTYDRLVEE